MRCKCSPGDGVAFATANAILDCMNQVELFSPALPRGLSYREDFITADEESRLLAEIRELPLKEAQYRQFTARRRTVN